MGQHIGIIVAETSKQAQSAAALASVRYGHPRVNFIPHILKIKPCMRILCIDDSHAV